MDETNLVSELVKARTAADGKPPNLVSQIIAEKKRATEIEAKLAEDENSRVSATEQAQAIPLAKKNNIPVDVARRNLATLQGEDAAAKASAAAADAPSYRKLLSDSTHGPIAQSDIDDMPTFERIIRGTGQAWTGGWQSVDQNELAAKMAEGSATPADVEEWQRLNSEQKKQPNYNLGPFEAIPSYVVGSAPQMIETTKDAAPAIAAGAATGAATGAAIGAAGGTFAMPGGGTLAGAGGGAVAGAIRGAAAGFWFGQAHGNFRQLGGEAYGEAITSKDENGDPLSQEVAKGIYYFAGTIGAGTELLPMERLLHTMPGLGKYLTKVGGKGLVSLAAKSPAARASLARMGRLFEVGAVESATEIVQEASKLEKIIAAGGVTDQNGQNLEDQRASRYGQAGWGGFWGGVGMAGAGETITAGTNKVQSWRRTRADARQKALVELGDRIRASKVAGMSPETIVAHAQQMDKDGAAPPMTAPAEALVKLFQSEGLTPEEVQAQFPAVAQALNEAVEGNADVPLNAEAVLKLARLNGFSELTGDIRVNGEPSANEAKANDEEFQASLEGMSDEDIAQAVTASAEADFVRQMVATGMEPRVAETNAKLLVQGMSRLAQESGKDLATLMNEYRLQISGDDSMNTEAAPDETTMGQSIQDAPVKIDPNTPVPLVKLSGSAPEAYDWQTEKAWLKENLQGQSFSTPDGVPVRVSSQTSKMARSHQSDGRRAVVLRNLPEVIRNAVVYSELPDTKDRANLSYVYAAAHVEIEGKPYSVGLSYSKSGEGKLTAYQLNGFEIIPPGTAGDISAKTSDLVMPGGNLGEDENRGASPLTRSIGQVVGDFKAQTLFQSEAPAGGNFSPEKTKTFLGTLTARAKALVNPIYTGKVPAKKLKGNEEAARWLESNYPGKPITNFTKEVPDDVLREIGSTMAAEVLYALQKSGNAFDWYTEAMQRAMDIAAVKWPILGDDAAAAEAGFGTKKNARFVFTYIMAVTSQNLDVAANAAATNKAYDEMIARVKAGDFTMSKAWGTGDKQAAMGKNFAKFGPLIKAMPGATFPERLAALDVLFREKRTVAEWVKVLKAEGVPYTKPGQTAMDAAVYGSSLLGPKIGNGFWQNLNGNFSPLTIDLWMRRTWGRLTGKSIGNEAALPAQRRRLKASIERSINSPELDMDPLLETLMERRSVNAKIRALEARTDLKKKDRVAQIKKLTNRLNELEDIAADYRGIPAPEAWKPEYDKDDAALAAYAKRLLGAWNKEYKRLREKHGSKVPGKMQPTWARAAKRLKADLTTPLDQVANGTQRKQIEKAVAYAQQILARLGHDVTTADLQAILWYPEKELWGALTSKLEIDDDGAPVIPPSSLNESYDTVFTRILNAEGYSTPAQQGTAGNAGGGPDGGAVSGGSPGERGPGGSSGAEGVRQDSGGSPGQAEGVGQNGNRTLYQLGSERAGDGAGRYSSGSLAPLAGAPTIEGASGPDPKLVSVAERYARDNGISLRRQAAYVQVDPERASRIAAAYDAMPHVPNDPAVKEAYDNLIRQTLEQYNALAAAGYRFTFFDGKTDPYSGNPWNAMRDLRNNKHMAVYGTYDGFGTEGITADAGAENPMMADTGLRWPDQNGVEHPVLANDLFRAVHDAFGHGLEGAGFRAQGEENAWQAHVRLFTGSAVAAITTETRGQNSWLNFGPYGEQNRTARVEETVFAPQKTGLMPPWTWEEGRAADEAPETGPSSSGGATLDQTGQSKQTFARGQISFNATRSIFKITLTGRADLSTFQHEAAHYYLEVIQSLVASGAASPQMAADLEKIRAWMGLKAGEKIERRHHEQFARGWEAYLMEGRAPSIEMQGAFNRFRAWMVFVYKRLAALNVELTDEVRGVMDRLVASDAAIAEARTNIGFGKPLPKQALYLTDDEYDRYVASWNKAAEAQQRELDARLMLDAAREATKAWKDERRKVFDEEKAKLEKTRGWIAWKALTTGEGLDNAAPGRTSLKIDPESVPAEWSRDTTGMTGEGGLPLETVAEVLGFDSGEQMLSLIAGAKFAMRDLPGQVKRLMEERHGALDMAGLADLATEAVQGGDTQEVLLTEFRAMAAQAKLPAAPKGLLQWMAAQAQQKLLGLNRRQLDPARWRRAQLKASAESARAAAKGDMNMAAIKKRQQMMASAMERATIQAQKRIDTIRKKLMPFTKNDRRAQLGKAGDLYLDGIDQILEGIQLKPMSAAGVQKLDRLAKLVEEADKNGEPLVLPDKLRAMLGKKNFEDMTLEELEGVHDAVMNLWHLAKMKNELRARAETRDLENLITEMEAVAQAEMGDPKIRDSFVKGKLDRAKALLRMGRAQLIKMEFLFSWFDGKPSGGLLHRFIYQPLADASKAEYQIMKHFKSELIDRMRNMPAEQKARWESKRKFMGMDANGATIIAAALNLGNASNKVKLLKGYGWNEQQLLAEINAFMTKADWDMVQHIWDQINTLWPQIEETTRQATGLRPEKVAASPVVTPFGTYSGGYYPVVYDPDRTEQAFKNQQKEKDLFSNNFVRPTLGDGFTKARVDYAAPILLDLAVISRHLSEVVHYVTHYEAITQADKITRHPRFQAMVAGRVGNEFYREIRPWLQDIARAQDSPTVTQREILSKGLKGLRAGVSIASMGYNIFTGFKQLYGVTTALDAISPGYWMLGLQKAWMSPSVAENWRFAMKESSELEQLVTSFDRDIKMVNDAYAKQFAGGIFNAAVRHAFSHIGMFQLAVNVATWHGAYAQARGSGKDHAAAVMDADSVVRKTQSGGAIKDLSAVQRGSEASRMVSMFYTWFSVLYNRLEDIAREQKSIRDVPRTARRLAVLVVLSAMIEETGRRAYQAAMGSDDEEKKDEAGYVLSVLMKSGDMIVGTVPLLRAFVSFEGVSKGLTPEITPLSRVANDYWRGLEAVGKLAVEGKAPTRGEVKALTKSVSIVTGKPIAGIYNLVDEFFGENIFGKK